ncbi:SWI/SNF-related matrix-associated actin-dependent regulator of chromatin subfamily A protein [Trifolium repens]|nr:SWI/SNF-related matrix-associated actin-dependent regulator of chromatin subfamily A protein [Trifolium repens]
MDREQTVIAATTYQSWLQDPSALVSKRGGMKKLQQRHDIMSSTKIANLMEVPPGCRNLGLPPTPSKRALFIDKLKIIGGFPFTTNIVLISGTDLESSRVEERINSLTGTSLSNELKYNEQAFDEKIEKIFNLAEKVDSESISVGKVSVGRLSYRLFRTGLCRFLLFVLAFKKIVLQLERVKAKIKASKSQEEAELLKFTQKNLINKIYTDSAKAKIPAVLDYVGTVIEASCKFVSPLI